MSDINCLNPRIILHPRFAELMARYKHWFFKGVEKRIYKCRHIDDINTFEYNPKRNKISHDDIKDCFFVDDETGECYPFYLEVPCGHCDICKVSKINSFVTRCRYESQMYDSLPWFITLTYDNDHVRYPEFRDIVCKDLRTGQSCVRRMPVGGVSVRDAQLFLKRLRRNIERSSRFNFRFRYVLVAEYGKKPITGTFPRPHYHAILFGVNTYTKEDHLAFLELIRKSWQNGNVRHRLMNLCDDDKGTYYTCKYLKKDCEVPEGCAPTFMLFSRRGGGIGSGFIDKIAPELRRTMNIQFKFTDKWTGKVNVLQYSRYLLDRVFPSFFRSVSSKFRSSVRLIITYGRALIGTNYENMDYEKLHCYEKYFYCGFNELNASYAVHAPRAITLRSMMAACYDFYKYFCDVDFCEIALRLSELRHVFLSKLFQFQYPIDKKIKAYQCHQILNYSSIYQVL